MLMDKAHDWPVLRRMIGKDWMVGPGIALLREHPRLARRISSSRSRHARLDGQHRAATSSSAWTSG